MKIEQIYTGCLAHAAYYIESDGVAAIFDPLREVQPYVDRAVKDNAKIKYVFETHFHADFVSGHLDLAYKTGAEIVYGPTAKPGFKATVAEDGQLFYLGKYTIKAIHTPGHTMESTCYLLIDENGTEHGLISGDTLFIDDVGRPDLAQHVVAELTQEKLASHLYDSLRNKIMPLSDHLIIYPNHGAGSACGKRMSKEKTDTLGHQKQVNYALRSDMTKEEFIQEVLEGLTTPPAYFPKNVLLNINGYESYDSIVEKGLKALNAEEFELTANQGDILVLDTRDPKEFAKSFIPNSINVGIDGNFANWVGTLIPDLAQRILIVSDIGREQEVITRLSRVGYDNPIGYLNGGYETWINAHKETDSISRIQANEIQKYTSENTLLIDIRNSSEFNLAHVQDAINIPLDVINSHLAEFPKEKSFVMYCGGGYRSMIASSILKSRGWNNFVDVEGGFDAIEKTDIQITYNQCLKNS